MARELFIGTHGSEDPTKATLPFLLASGAIDAGHEVVLIDSTVADNVQGVGLPPLKELIAKLVDNKVPIAV